MKTQSHRPVSTFYFNPLIPCGVIYTSYKFDLCLDLWWHHSNRVVILILTLGARLHSSQLNAGLRVRLQFAYMHNYVCVCMFTLSRCQIKHVTRLFLWGMHVSADSVTGILLITQLSIVADNAYVVAPLYLSSIWNQNIKNTTLSHVSDPPLSDVHFVLQPGGNAPRQRACFCSLRQTADIKEPKHKPRKHFNITAETGLQPQFAYIWSENYILNSSSVFCSFIF